MSDGPNQSLSDEMRDATERSVEQARQAFDRFIDAARRGADKTRDAAEAARSGARDVSTRGFEQAGRNIDAAFELARKMVRAKDAREVVELQAEYVRAQFGAMQEQAKELGSLATGAMDRDGR